MKNGQGFPTAVCGVKFDPFVGDYSGFDCASRLDFWQSKGVNAVFAIACHRCGHAVFPVNEADTANCPTRVYSRAELGGSEDLLRQLVQGARARGMYLSLGFWMFRDDPMYLAHPDWRQRLFDGSDGEEQLLCPRSPYMTQAFFPTIRYLYARYGVSDYFLQEMWMEADARTNSRACYCDHCIERFSALENHSYTRAELVKTIEKDAAVREKWRAFHYDTLKKIVEDIEKIAPGGAVLWHNPSPHSEWASMADDRCFTETHLIGDMSLFPDEQIFARGDTNVIDPFIQYAHHRRFVSVFGSDDKTTEFLSLYGMPGLTRVITPKDVYRCYLAARAAGISGFIIEQDKMIDWAEEHGGQGIWDALGDCYTRLQPLFEHMAYQGDLSCAPIAAQGAGAYGGWWKRRGDGQAIFIVGTKATGEATVVSHDGCLRDGLSEQRLTNTIEIPPLDVRLFLSGGEGGCRAFEKG